MTLPKVLGDNNMAFGNAAFLAQLEKLMFT